MNIEAQISEMWDAAIESREHMTELEYNKLFAECRACEAKLRMKHNEKPSLDNAIFDLWRPVEEIPDWYSFQCLIKFKEFGINGPGNQHVSTGTWWHKDQIFIIDNVEMQDFTPAFFIPIYDNI